MLKASKSYFAEYLIKCTGYFKYRKSHSRRINGGGKGGGGGGGWGD